MAKFQTLLGQAHFEAKEYGAAAEAFFNVLQLTLQGRVNPTPQFIRDARIWLGASWMKSGKVDEGIGVIQQTLAGDTTYEFGVLWMSQAYLLKDHPKDALQWALTVLVKQQQDPMRKRNFAHILGAVPNGVDLLIRDILQSAATPEASSVWTFLATIAKDHGLVTQAIALMQHIHRVCPENAGIVLQLAHDYEVTSESHISVGLIVDYLKRVRAKRIEALHHFSIEDALGTIGGDILDRPSLASPKLSALPSQVVRMRDDNDYDVRLVTEAEAATISCGRTHIAPLADSEEERAPKSARAARQQRGGSSLPQEDLELLAICFTLVKTLFVCGHLEHLPALCNLTYRIREGQRLHESIIRNEHAYFATIALAMQYLPPTQLAEAAQLYEANQRVYVVGDSHTLTCSWHSVNWPKLDDPHQTERRCLVNRLVTGLKVWHMRRESTFYPSVNFERVVRTLPEGSDVVFLFGEIDCREGVLEAVERFKYASIEEAFDKLTKIYIEALIRCATLRKMKRVFVHFPVASLTATATVVLKFCAALREGMKNIQRVGPAQLIPVDVNPFVIDEQSKKLRPEFQFDETHVSPAYLPFLEQAVANAAVAHLAGTTTTS